MIATAEAACNLVRRGGGESYRMRLAGPGSRLDEMFEWLRALDASYADIVEGQRGLVGARLSLEQIEGDGFWRWLRVPGDMDVLAADCIYNEPRLDTLAGEGNVEFCVALSGRSQVQTTHGTAIELCGPSVLLLRQNEGCPLRQRIAANERMSFVSVHCRPKFLQELIESSNAESARGVLDPLGRTDVPLFHRHMALTAGMAACARRIQQSPLSGRLRLAHDAAKAVELVCLILDELTRLTPVSSAARRNGQRAARLDRARMLLHTQLSPVPSVRRIARAVGMSESKLKRDFKQRFGKTLFDYSLDRRMLTAMNLLESTNLPIGTIATQVGYRHHTSFAEAFKRYFGVSPKSVKRA